MASVNGIMGSDGYGVDLPKTEVDDETKKIVAEARKFAKSKEFQVLKEHLEQRITFYQNYLPDGRPIVQILDDKERADMWTCANVVIGEFKAIISGYEHAALDVQPTE